MIFFTVVAIFAIIFYFLNNYLLNYWKRRGVPQNDVSFFFGDIKNLFEVKSTIYDLLSDNYTRHKNLKIFGLYLSYRRALLVTDPELIQNVLIKDFNVFQDRGLPTNEEKDPLSATLFSLGGEKWRNLRVKLTPVFSSGKLKGMYPTIQDCIKVLDKYLDENVKQGNDVFEFRDLLARLTTDIISSVAFGVESNCINDKNSKIREMGAKIFEKSLRTIVLGVLMLFFPKIFSYWKLRSISREIENFIMSIVEGTIHHREVNKINRKDLMQLLIQLKNEGFVAVDRNDGLEKSEDLRKLSINEIAAQVFIFFLGGFETSSSTMSFCLYELCKNHQIQRKVHEEIDDLLKSSPDGSISYDMLNELKYLECCIDETLRKYPVLPFLMRQNNRDYVFDGTDAVIEKDTFIFIPTLAIHRDPEIFENPLEFRPERFLNSATGNGDSKGLFYMPFGDGPRKCIGERMGKIQTKLGLAMILAKYSIDFADGTDENLKYDITNHFVLTADQPFNFKVTPRYLNEEDVIYF